MAFDRDTTTDQVLVGIDLTGVRAIVTGASSGIGEETARALASVGAEVTLAVRNVAKGEEVASRIRASTGNEYVDVGEVELSVPDSVRAFAEKWLHDNDGLNLLINNAGVMAAPLMRTEEGWEMQFATNHFGHFLLTKHLLPALRVGAPGRIVNLSSAGHRISDVDFEDPQFERRPYDKWTAYGQSKTANILFSVELTKRLAADGITANAVHPGTIATELGRHMDQADIEALMARSTPGRVLQFKTIPAGAATSVWAATAPELAGRGGLYLEDCHTTETAEGPLGTPGCAPYALDPDHALNLWELSEKALGEHFDQE